MDPLHRAPSSTLPQRVRPRPAVSIASRVYAAHLPTPALLTRSSYFLRLLANTPFQIQVLVRLPSLPLHGIKRALPGRVREDGHPGEVPASLPDLPDLPLFLASVRVRLCLVPRPTCASQMGALCRAPESSPRIPSASSPPLRTPLRVPRLFPSPLLRTPCPEFYAVPPLCALRLTPSPRLSSSAPSACRISFLFVPRKPPRPSSASLRSLELVCGSRNGRGEASWDEGIRHVGDDTPLARCGASPRAGAMRRARGAGEVYAESRCQRASSPGGAYPRRAARKNIAGAGVVRAEGAEAHGGRLAAWAQRVACDTGAGGDAGVGLLDVRGARLAVFASGADRG
ncbi:hypothetical protein B0H17DRAFT_1332833 [Mycena rosella]|uniref:Uncharacterized protein n=1 Tax=Mycena rosella TaxID=1033263 RepID=A0AAD7GFH4_MYCRO|nr:hypothetical protein B0H17DRAFT_1332833 [Mycena rosella]